MHSGITGVEQFTWTDFADRLALRAEDNIIDETADDETLFGGTRMDVLNSEDGTDSQYDDEVTTISSAMAGTIRSKAMTGTMNYMVGRAMTPSLRKR